MNEPLVKQQETIESTLQNWQKGLYQTDDITILSVKWKSVELIK